VADWGTVTAYLIAAILAARAAGTARLARQARDRTFWSITAPLLVFLGVNELLDLQALLTSVGRAHAEANGWYGERRHVQYAFLLALGVLAVCSGTVMLWLTRRTHLSVRLALAGLFFIGLFVLIRAASFHHADEVLGRGPAVFNWGSLQELMGIIVIGAAAALYTRNVGSRAKRPRTGS
jgi:hypothetical protein